MDTEDTVTRVRVVDDVERPVAGRDDRCAVHRRRALDPDERAVAGAGDSAGLEVRQREAGGAGLGDPGRAEVRRTLEVDERLSELVLVGRRRIQRHGLDAIRATDADVPELGRVVDAQIVGDPLIRGVDEDVPDGFTRWPSPCTEATAPTPC